MKKINVFLMVSLLTLGLAVSHSYAHGAWNSDWMSSDTGTVEDQGTSSAVENDWMSSGNAAESDWMTSEDQGTLSAAESDWMTSNASAKSDFRTFNSSDLIGAPVKDQEGDLLGLISLIQIDSKGHAFAVINHGDYDNYGEGGAFTPVPFDALKISEETPGEVTVALNMDKDQLEAAPFFDPTRGSDQQYEADIYRYYGIQPYWTESSECANRDNNQSDWDTLGRMDNSNSDYYSPDSSVY